MCTHKQTKPVTLKIKGSQTRTEKCLSCQKIRVGGLWLKSPS